jgi:putative ABC transport system permease protein
MTLANFNVFIRNSQKQKGIGLIKMLGLVTGMLSTILIMEYVLYERSFDKGHGEDVYRVAYNRYGEEGLMWKTANFFPAAGPYLKQTWPEVEDYVTLRRNYNITFSCTDASGYRKIFNEPKSYYGTSSFFSVFRIPVTKGSGSSLNEPRTIALSERATQKYFGNTDPIGQSLIMNEKDTFTVTTVYQTLPQNMHFQIDFLLSWQTVIAKKPETLTNWSGDNGHTYIKLKPGTDYKEFEAKACTKMIQDNYADQQIASGERDEIFLQPVRSIHLHSNLEYEPEPTGNSKAVSILFYFSIFLLIIAWINYINIENAKAIERAKEIGIKKTNGSTQWMLIRQFISEAVVFNLFCYAVTIFLYILINPIYKKTVGIAPDVLVTDAVFWGVFSLIVILGVAVSSAYPAWVLSSFRPIEVLRGHFEHSKHSLVMRKGLVTLQFILSILLITGTLVTYEQVHYLMSKDMGVNIHSKLVVKAPAKGKLGDNYFPKMNVLLERLKQNPTVTNWTYTSDIPGQEILGWFSCYPKGSRPEDKNDYFGIHSDADFQSCFDIKLLAGRSFRSDDKIESNYMLMNKTALKRIGYKTPEEAVGKVVLYGSKEEEWTIIGVYDDFHYRSIKVDAVPTCFTLQEKQRRYVVLKFNAESTSQQESLNRFAQKAYEEVFPGLPYDSFYLEDFMKEDLRTDKTFVAVFGLFSVLALIIALIGITGLLLIFTFQNIKDFGVRKVLGAEKEHLFLYFFKQFYWQLLMAILIAIPLGWIGLNSWLTQNYVSHIELKPHHFLISIVIIVSTLALVMYRMAAKTYRMNVIDVINYE